MEKSASGSFMNRLHRKVSKFASKNPDDEVTSFHGATFNRRVFRAFSILRYLTLVMTSFFYLLGPYPPSPSFKVFIPVILFVLAAVSINIYQNHQKNTGVVKLLALLETYGITALVIFTGGLASPFVWYMLNPLVLSSMHLHFVYTWSFAGLFLAGGILGELYLGGMLTLVEAALVHGDTLLVLVLLTLVIHIFARVYYTLAEQSQRLELQQEELVGAYIDLSENHQVMQTLSDFQRNIVACKNEHDIYTQLVAATTFAFPFDRAAVLALHEPLFPESTQPFNRYQLISDGKISENYLDETLVNEVRDRWQELFSRQGIVIGQGRTWLAFPIRMEKKKTIAILVAQTKDTGSMNRVKENLSFYIQFSEQVIQRLRNLRQTEETLQHLSNIYEAVETISRRDDPREILDLFCAYARSLTGCEKVVFWVEQMGSGQDQTDDSSIYSVKGQISVFPEEHWHGALLRAWSEIKENPAPLVQLIENDHGQAVGQMVCVPVKSFARCYGIMAGLHSKKKYGVEEIMQKLTFLSKLGAIAIERNATELFADKLLLLEEQKRIANEIHDSISQNLFSIVYGLESVSKHSDMLNSKLRNQISSIQEVASQTAKELRVLIYRLSPRKRGDDTFIKEIRDYLNGLSNINDIVISLDVEGSEEYLNQGMRNAFYRIVKEATGNSIRHGQSEEVKVKLEMTPFQSTLEIVDNGKGFNVSELEEESRFKGGLGIINMRELTHSLQGSFEIQSVRGEGTRVSCYVPTSPVYSKGHALSNK